MTELALQREDLPLLGMRRLLLTAPAEVVLVDVVAALERHGAWVGEVAELADGGWQALLWQSTILPPYSFTVEAATAAQAESRAHAPKPGIKASDSVQSAARRLFSHGR